MNDAEYRQKLNAFKNSCRTYVKEKENLKKLLHEVPGVKNVVTMDDHGVLTITEIPSQKESDKVPMTYVRLYQYMLEDIWFVEHTLDRVEAFYGNEARSIIESMLVNGTAQSDAARQYHLTRWQIQERSGQWLRKALSEDKDDGEQ